MVTSGSRSEFGREDCEDDGRHGGKKCDGHDETRNDDHDESA